MTSPAGSERAADPVQIKKYPNRRYYDATRSRHVTLRDLYELIAAGRDISVTDSRSGEDITNLVLLQILLDKESPKLSMLPSGLLHKLIRAHPEVLREVLERLRIPIAGLLAASQEQIEAWRRAAAQVDLAWPLDWAGGVMRRYVSRSGEGEGTDDAREANRDGLAAATLAELRQQAAELTRRIEGLEASRSAPETGE